MPIQSTATRLLFPEDRTAFIFGKPGEPILTPYRTGLKIFLDQAATTPADILTVQGEPIQYSTIYTGDDTLLPLFYGPINFVNRVWAKIVGGDPTSTYDLNAQYSEQLLQVPTLLTGTGAPSDSIGTTGSTYLDTQAHVLYGPKAATWPMPGVPLQGPPGPSSGSYEHQQISPAATWVIDHPLTYRPNVSVIDSAGFEILADVSYPLVNRVVIEFSSQLGGTALLS